MNVERGPAGAAVRRTMERRTELVAYARAIVGGTQIATSAAAFYSDTGLSASTSYTYAVAAVDAAGNVSGVSAPVSGTTSAPSGDAQAPTVPTGLTATAVSSSQIDLSWTAATDNVGVTAYRILRDGAPVATVTSGTSHSDAGLTPLTAYAYTVVALDAAGNASAASGSAPATTLAATSGGGGSGKGGGSHGCGLLGLEALLLLGLARRRRR